MLISFNLMLNLTTLVASSLVAATALVPISATASTNSKTDIAVNSQTQISEPIEIRQKGKRYVCKGCNDYENQTLEALQDRGILDKNALATIMGNIYQESNFIPNICEGGARVTYENCRRGGFGLIQFTAISRYNGLGMFAKQVGGDPSSFPTQLNYMFTEPEWLRIEEKLKTPGKPIERYMAYAHSWLGWGIHGGRTAHAYNYARRLVPVETDT